MDHLDLMARLRKVEPVLPRDDDWRREAACRDTDPSVFFREEIQGPWNVHNDERQTGQARRICLQCPVRAECLGDALSGNDVGVRGGLTMSQRKKLRSTWPWFKCIRCLRMHPRGMHRNGGRQPYYCPPCGSAVRHDTKAESRARCAS